MLQNCIRYYLQSKVLRKCPEGGTENKNKMAVASFFRNDIQGGKN